MKRTKMWLAKMRAEGRCEYCGAEAAQSGRCADCRTIHAKAQDGARRARGIEPRGIPYRCRRCGVEGHNRRTCGAP